MDPIIKQALWAEKKIKEAEADDPLLAALKKKAREAMDALKAAQGEEILSAIAVRTEADWAVINHLSARTK